MKRVIRNCVWETNSSTTHSCTIMTKAQSDLWEEGNVYYYEISWWNSFEDLPKEEQPVNGMFYSQDEVLKFLEKIGYHYDPKEFEDDVTQFIKECDCDFMSYSMWEDDDWLDRDANTYTTPGGEEIVVYCKYGRDG